MTMELKRGKREGKDCILIDFPGVKDKNELEWPIWVELEDIKSKLGFEIKFPRAMMR
jgi:hypothetical protein